MKIMQWNIETGNKIKSLDGHNGDVAALSLKPQDNNIFVTGSVDRTIRLWDLRTECAQQTFWGHEADVNSACFHPGGFNFVTCSEDKTSRLWDLRSDQASCYYRTKKTERPFQGA